MDLPIQVRDLTKSYGTFEAVRGIDFEVHAGEVFGLLGPNGAGKTTTVEILEGLRPRSGGEVRVLGFDPGRQARELKDRIGVCLQSTNLPEKLRVAEALETFAALYSRTVSERALLERLQLEDKRDASYGQLSGGQKQRLALALALVNDPQVLFLDEPTTGLDPQARLEIHELVLELRREERTVLLTTHYMDEAEKLCDRVAIVDGGRIIAMGTPGEIRGRTAGHSVIQIRTQEALPLDGVPALNGDDKMFFSEDRHTLTVHATHPAHTVVEMVKWLDQRGVELSDLHVTRPSLEDVFIEMTGRRLRD